MLDIDYTGTGVFLDTLTKRRLSIGEAIIEGYFDTVEEAKGFLCEKTMEYRDDYLSDKDDFLF